ncbi:MAG: iron-regulated protein [Verrucomicrobia bacterium]|jgi:putative iron-regulated protein|nr:iron-regulated protein [Verrucomicrobiota bacterium]
MKRFACRRQFLILLSSASLGVCLRSSAADEAETVRRFLHNYASILHATYTDSWSAACELQQSIEKFLKSPSEEGLKQARQAWIAARVPYLQTEVARFYDGPIEAVEGFVNAWPIDENYIDYTAEAPMAGIINNPQDFAKLTVELLVSVNEKEGEKNISTGWHAIEFLLWGQDLHDDSPGRRSYLDYVKAGDGIRRHAERRGEYLRLITKLLVGHLKQVADEWAPEGKTNYRAGFLIAPAHESLEKVIRGMGAFSGAELGGERTMVAYTTKEQEDEHSCFSDTTHQDMRYDQIGIVNICLGRYQRLDRKEIRGTGLLDVIGKKDAAMASKLQKQLVESLKAIEGIPVPFDQAMKGRDTAPGRLALKRAIDALQAQTKTLAAAAKELGIQLNL